MHFFVNVNFLKLKTIAKNVTFIDTYVRTSYIFIYLLTVPGAPSNVSFPDVSVTSARIIWDVPEEPNGEILAYKVTYHLDNVKTNNKFSKEFPPSGRTFRFVINSIKFDNCKCY